MVEKLQPSDEAMEPSDHFRPGDVHRPDAPRWAETQPSALNLSPACSRQPSALTRALVLRIPAFYGYCAFIALRSSAAV